MWKKLTIEFCQKTSNSRGYFLHEETFFGSKSNCTFTHLECGRSFIMRWSAFYDGQGCVKCFIDKRKLNLDDCKVFALNEGYLINDDTYINTHSKLNFTHTENDCNYSFNMAWLNFSQGQRCPKCAGKIKLTINYVKETAFLRGYRINDSEYINTLEYLSFTHLSCGYTFPMVWGSFQQNHGCPKCSGVLRLTMEYCVEQADKKECDILTKDYKNNQSKMEFLHRDCERTFITSWDNFSQTHGCPHCSRELQQSPTASILKDYYYNNYNALWEYKPFRNPKTGYPLPFDIFIPSKYENSKDIFIEVQGHQHYKFTPRWHVTLENFKYYQWKDKIKKEYAEQNGIYIEIDLRQKEDIDSIIERINQIIYDNDNGYY
jgi:hypothetical protein